MASHDLPLSGANFVVNTNTATNHFKRGIFQRDRTKQAIIPTIASRRLEERAKKMRDLLKRWVGSKD